MKRPHLLGIVASAGLTLLGCGRVERTMYLTSNVDGALVYLNGEEVGRTPLKQPFMWYGKYDVELRKDGYETTRVKQKVPAPWWQWMPFDLMADLLPGRKVDSHTYYFKLEPQREVTAAGRNLEPAMLELRSQLESGKYTRKPAATNPATAPAD